jgi:multidrug efflux pump subunit AcrA (membrane-fusion protein)
MRLAGRLWLALGLALPLAACHSEPPARPAEPPVVRDVVLSPAAVTEHAEAQAAVGTVKSRTVTTLSSKLVGRIQALHVREGSRVEAGQLLVELDDRDIASQVRRAEAGLAEVEAGLAEVDRAIAAAAAARTAAEAQRDLAQATLGRYERLLERRSVAPAEFDQVSARHKAASAEVERAAAEMQAIQAKRRQALARIEAAHADIATARAQLEHARIPSPLSGMVTAKHADVGSLAAPGAPLLTIEDSRRYWLEAAVPESQVGRLRPGQLLRVAVEAASVEGTAALSEILPAADPASRTTVVRLDLPASWALRSGLFGRVWVPAGRREAIRVPRTAVLERGQLEGVYVVGSDRLARFRIIRTGAAHDGQVEVLSGLSAGEQIVVQGIDKLTDGARVEASAS